MYNEINFYCFKAENCGAVWSLLQLKQNTACKAVTVKCMVLQDQRDIEYKLGNKLS